MNRTENCSTISLNSIQYYPATNSVSLIISFPNLLNNSSGNCLSLQPQQKSSECLVVLKTLQTDWCLSHNLHRRCNIVRECTGFLLYLLALLVEGGIQSLHNSWDIGVKNVQNHVSTLRDWIFWIERDNLCLEFRSVKWGIIWLTDDLSRDELFFLNSRKTELHIVTCKCSWHRSFVSVNVFDRAHLPNWHNEHIFSCGHSTTLDSSTHSQTSDKCLVNISNAHTQRLADFS
mmetsp:Transcript_605/g.2162  ORF Transcript_605/g.2162 Transcript_605/m.2162 type:complete len:232 (+) Transcript_605:2974-3669(+)